MSYKKTLEADNSIVSSFISHLSDPLNSRILFSAPFGTGKTTFLRQLFTKNKRFVVTSINPVNYSLLSNQDIFEQIKFDLLFDILQNWGELLQFENTGFSKYLIAQMFALHELKLLPSLSIIPKLSTLLPDYSAVPFVLFDDLITHAKSYAKSINIDELREIKSYMNHFESVKGGLYENDEITVIITSLVIKIKTLQQEKLKNFQTLDNKTNTSTELNSVVETVLIIEDLDRLDPEHVFRLFNAFSAHYDFTTNDNKFGFDKIIFVCDYENIKKMYLHRYGIGVDFSGYIDKFYSTLPFRFDNRSFCKESIMTILKEKPNLIAKVYNRYNFLAMIPIEPFTMLWNLC